MHFSSKAKLNLLKNNYLHRGTQIVAGIIFLIAALIILLPPNHNYFKSVSVFAPQLMFGLLFLSFIFLVFEKKSLMIIAMLSAALIAFFLKTASNNNLILPLENNSVKTEIVLFNLDNCDPNDTDLIGIINELDVDIIALQEYSQEWDKILNNALIKEYPYAHKLKRDDSFGFAIFTRKKIFKIDNFYYNEIPNLKIAVDNGNGKLTIISSYLPLDYRGENQRVEEHISKLTEEIKSSRYPVLVLGDFNKMYWSNELLNFMKLAELENSRRSISIENLNPDDHIFYTKRLECINFQEIKNKRNKHLGIRGIYQLKQ